MKPRKKTAKAIIPSEHEEQVKVVTYLNKRGFLNFAIPNGGHRHFVEAVKLKRSGVQPGVPDLYVPMARKGYHGLFLELKRTKGGVISEYQQYWIEQLTKQGYLAVIVKGAEEAIRVIEDYFNAG